MNDFGIEPLDAVVIGGGPAGTSAALLLGRMRHNVVVFDDGHHRNDRAERIHGVSGHDGRSVADFLSERRKELSSYPTVRLDDASVVSIGNAGPTSGDPLFSVSLNSGPDLLARRLILATGLVDEIDVDAAAALWGSRVFNCPYCHGWEHRDQRVAVAGGDHGAAVTALTLSRMTPEVHLHTGPDHKISGDMLDAVARSGVIIHPDALRTVEEANDTIDLIGQSGQSYRYSCLFLVSRKQQSCSLAEGMGCAMSAEDRVDVDADGRTSVAGVFAVGDMAARAGDSQPSLAAIAMAGGARAAVAVNLDLTFTDAFGSPEPE